MPDCYSVLVSCLMFLAVNAPLKAQSFFISDKHLSTSARLDRVKELSKAGKKATKEDIASLTHFLRDKAPEVRTEAVTGLANILLEQNKICPRDLVRTLLDPHAEVRGAAATMVGLFQKFSDDSLPVLLEAMQSEDALVRANVPTMLAQWGKEAQVVAALKKATSDKNWLTRNNAGVALGKILDDVSIPLPCWLEAIGMAGNPKSDKKEAAAVQLIAIGGAAQMKGLSKEKPKVLAAIPGR